MTLGTLLQTAILVFISYRTRTKWEKQFFLCGRNINYTNGRQQQPAAVPAWARPIGKDKTEVKRPVRWLVSGLVWTGWCWFYVRGKHCWLAGLGWLKPTSEQSGHLEPSIRTRQWYFLSYRSRWHHESSLENHSVASYKNKLFCSYLHYDNFIY